MFNQVIILQWLALIKHLYRIEVDQSRQFETIAPFSILSLHDSIEMYLKLLAELKNLKAANFRFLDYWDNIEAFPLQASLRRANRDFFASKL